MQAGKKSLECAQFEMGWAYCIPGPLQKSLPDDGSDFAELEIQFEPPEFESLTDFVVTALDRHADWKKRELECVREFIIGTARKCSLCRSEGWSCNCERRERGRDRRMKIVNDIEENWGGEFFCHFPESLIEFTGTNLREEWNPLLPVDVEELADSFSEFDGSSSDSELRQWLLLLAQSKAARREIMKEGHSPFDEFGNNDFYRWMDGEPDSELDLRYSNRIKNEQQRALLLPDYLKLQGLSEDHELWDQLQDLEAIAQTEFRDSSLDVLCALKWQDIRLRRLYRWFLNPSGMLNFVCEAFYAGTRLWCRRMSHVPVQCRSKKDLVAFHKLAETVLSECREAFTRQAPSSLLGRDDLSIVRWVFPLIAIQEIPDSLIESIDDQQGYPLLDRIESLQLQIESEPDLPLDTDQECRVIGRRFVKRAVEEAARFGCHAVVPNAVKDETEALGLISQIVDECLARLPEDAVPLSLRTEVQESPYHAERATNSENDPRTTTPGVVGITSAKYEWSDPMLPKNWKARFGWSDTTWKRRRNDCDEAFKDIPGSNMCKIRKDFLELWDEEARAKTG